MAEVRHGTELVATLPVGVQVMGMLEYQGTLILATSIGVYRLDCSLI